MKLLVQWHEKFLSVIWNLFIKIHHKIRIFTFIFQNSEYFFLKHKKLRKIHMVFEKSMGAFEI